MLKKEFEDFIGHEITDDQFKSVENVYNYHPVNLNADEMVFLWQLGGQTMIEFLEEKALSFHSLEKKKESLTTELEKIQAEMDEMREAY